MINGDADEILPGLAAAEEVVLFERDEEDVDVKDGQIDLIDVKGGNVLGERGALRGGEDVRVGVDSPGRHGCCVLRLPIRWDGLVVERSQLGMVVMRMRMFFGALLWSYIVVSFRSIINYRSCRRHGLTAFSYQHSIWVCTDRPIRKFLSWP